MKKYYVNDYEYETIEEATDAVFDDMEEDVFEEWLHEEHGYYVDICDNEYDPVDVLRAMGDFDDMMGDWKSEHYGEAMGAIARLDVGDSETIFGSFVEVKDTDAEMFEEARKHITAVTDFVQFVPSVYANNASTIEELNAISAFIDEMEKRIMEE